jgi:tRNA threonylcarbamoyladenosine biosynthesis protein TsaB
MRLLALETSGRLGSISLVESRNGTTAVLAESDLPAGERSARTLLPAVHDALADQGWRPADIDLIAVTTGPGSFTGLRIGVVAAKTLAYALGAKLVGVHTLVAIAENASTDAGVDSPPPARLWTVLDAQRQELFAASFDLTQPVIDQAQPATKIIAIDAWLERLRRGDAVAGPPLAKLASRLPDGVAAVPHDLWPPSAAATGRLGFALFQRGVAIEPLELVPHYYRRSAAEEKAAARSAPQTPP